MLKVYSPQSKMEEQYLDNEGLSQEASHGKGERWKNARPNLHSQ